MQQVYNLVPVSILARVKHFVDHNDLYPVLYKYEIFNNKGKISKTWYNSLQKSISIKVSLQYRSHLKLQFVKNATDV